MAVSPLVTQVLNAELAKQGIEVNHSLCEHFAFTRQELYHLIRVEGIKSFDELLAKYGKGYGCEVCKPTVGSLLASCWNEFILKPQHTPLQDTNDNFLAKHPERRYLLRDPALRRRRNHAGRPGSCRSYRPRV
ncbi:nitrite reductase subunit NirD [Kluyvera cryocrescens]|uniref:Nitrite reductase subunit NirD n=1 Tax=Kluyvera cryocrescens TaxID=580 RepID=A0A485AF27_KLUCR|nr:nitrite reductase subunit NirD [Kluyvera cryocrescens]